jgi:hypothetical protein
MLSLLRSLFRQMIQEGSDSSAADSTGIQLAIASLLCEVAPEFKSEVRHSPI